MGETEETVTYRRGLVKTEGKMDSETVELRREMPDDYNYKEAIKTLRTNIQFCGSSIRTIMFTSSLPDEGKSDISFALAESLAQIGKKTVLIDADIR